MHEQLSWVKLETKPINYIARKLSNGKSFSQHILNVFDKVKIKKVFTLVPQNTIPDRMLKLEEGGICKTSDSNDKFIGYIASLNKNEYYIIFENNLKNKSDSNSKNIKVPYFTKGEEIYFFYSDAQHGIEVIKEILYEADRYPFIAFVIKKADHLHFNEIDEQKLEKMILSTEEILIGAYDEESYIRIEIEY